MSLRMFAWLRSGIRSVQAILVGMIAALFVTGYLWWLQAMLFLIMVLAGGQVLNLIATRLSPVKLPRADWHQVAYHEAGHAIVAWFHPDYPGAWEIKITPRSLLTAGLMTPMADVSHLAMHRRALADICVRLGGRAAEMIGCDDVSTCASADLELVRAEADSLVRTHGLGLGGVPRSYRRREDMITERLLQGQVDRIVSDCWEVAWQLLKKHEENLNTIALQLELRRKLTWNQLQGILGSPVKRRRRHD